MADPGDADFASLGWVRDGFSAGTVAFLEDLGEEAMAQEVVIAAWPSLFGEDASVVSAARCITPRGWIVGALCGHDLNGAVYGGLDLIA